MRKQSCSKSFPNLDNLTVESESNSEESQAPSMSVPTTNWIYFSRRAVFEVELADNKKWPQNTTEEFGEHLKEEGAASQ